MAKKLCTSSLSESGKVSLPEMEVLYSVRSAWAPVDSRSQGSRYADRPLSALGQISQNGTKPKFATDFIKGLIRLLALLVALAGGGCKTFQDNSLTCDLWRKDPTASASDRADGGDYLYGGWTRAGLTPLAVVGDATIISVGLGIGCMICGFAEACREGAQNGGSTRY